MARSGATKQFNGLSNGYGIASSAFGLLAMTNGAFFKGLIVQSCTAMNPEWRNDHYGQGNVFKSQSDGQ
jgi:hypothetical protein